MYFTYCGEDALSVIKKIVEQCDNKYPIKADALYILTQIDQYQIFTSDYLIHLINNVLLQNDSKSSGLIKSNMNSGNLIDFECINALYMKDIYNKHILTDKYPSKS